LSAEVPRYVVEPLRSVDDGRDTELPRLLPENELPRDDEPE
jgi:hypothetical protein